MIDNYQIQVAQTGFFYYANKFYKLLKSTTYDFKPGKYERYEIYVYEHRYPMHRTDDDELLLGTPVDTRVWRSNSNTIFRAAAMATDIGFYRASCFDARPRDMFEKQNAHLFAPARRLYSVFCDNANAVTGDVIIDKTPFELKPIRDEYEMAKRREYLLHRINSEKQKRQR